VLRNPIPLARRVAEELQSVEIARRAGFLGLEPPARVPVLAQALWRYGMLGGAVSIAAIRHGERPALTDDLGTLTFGDLDRRSNALANAWIARGLRAGDGVAILARNHRGFVDATFAAAKAGARSIFLNTDFAGPQIREVAGREGMRLLVHDDEYSAFLEGVEPPLGRYRAWTDDPDAAGAAAGGGAGEDTIEALIAAGDTSPPPKPAQQGSIVILTSGTTGTPKGANRGSPRSLTPIGALLGRVPFRSGESTLIGTPMFHSLGFAHALLAVSLGSMLILRRRFDPAQVVADIDRHRPSGLIVVPIMLQRLIDAVDADGGAHDLSSLRIVFVAGSQLGSALATRAQDALGDVVYNLYGSTEVAYASIATPADLRAAPDTVGAPTLGTRVRILDATGRSLPQGETGRVFVGNSMPFEGYTGGGSKELSGGLMSSGDLGHFDSAGRLFIDGRDDEMIVSGGENVFPAEIEDLLGGHPSISEAAAIGVEDEKFGQRLRAFVVLRPEVTMSEEDVRTYVRENLARYKVPREVVFIETMPRNPTGKILKKQLQEIAVG
jgi:fatty-acyl-CoA synthase